MITKAIIKQLNSSNNNHCLVFIPLLKKANATEADATVDATFITIRGIDNIYKVGDVVFVDFEDGEYNKPVILGKLFVERDDPDDVTTTIVAKATQTTTTSKLPESTYLGENTSDSLVTKVERAEYLSESNYENKQDKLISGTNLKTVNGESLLGTGNIAISETGDDLVTRTTAQTITGNKTFGNNYTTIGATIPSKGNGSTVYKQSSIRMLRQAAGIEGAYIGSAKKNYFAGIAYNKNLVCTCNYKGDGSADVCPINEGVWELNRYTDNAAGYSGYLPYMFDTAYNTGCSFPVASMAEKPLVITIKATSNNYIGITDVLYLVLNGWRFDGDNAAYNHYGYLTDYSVEVLTDSYTNDTWTKVFERTGVKDAINSLCIPTWSTLTGSSSSYVAIYGIRLTISGAAQGDGNAGKFGIAELRLIDDRPAGKPADATTSLSAVGTSNLYGELVLGANKSTSSIYPATTNTCSIGTGSRRFASVNATNFYEAGTALSNKYQAKGNYVTTNTSQTISGAKTLSSTLSLATNFYYDSANTCGLNANNSDIIGINGLYTHDLANGTAEGLRFYADGDKWDTLTSSNGTLYYRAGGTLLNEDFATAYKVYHTGNLSTATTSSNGLMSSSDKSNLDSHISNTSNPHGVTKAQVGLGSVVNTADSATPIKDGTTKFTTGGAYTELAKKLSLSGGTLSGAVTFANNTWNTMGDDCKIGDFNKVGTIGIMGAGNGGSTNTTLAFCKVGDASTYKTITFDGTTLSMDGYASSAGNSTTVGGYTPKVTGEWGTMPVIKAADGVMEIGKYIDFHVTAVGNQTGGGNDHDGRITGQVGGGTLTIPQKSGTIAVTGDIPTTLPNPNVIKFKDKDNNDASYNGASELDLSGGIYYATSAGSATNATYANNFGTSSAFCSYDLATNNTSDTWVPVLNGTKLQHRVIPTAYNNDPSTLSVAYATKATQDACGNDIAGTYVPQLKHLGDGVDLNTVLTSGFYRLSGEPTNGPGGINYGQLIVSRAGGDTVAQLAFPFSVSACYIRTASGVTVSENPSWHDWRAVTFDDQFSYSDGTLTISI